MARERKKGEGGLLLNDKLIVTGSATLKGLLRGWFEHSSHLKCNFGNGKLPIQLSIEKTVLLYLLNNQVTEQGGVDLRRFMETRRIKRLADHRTQWGGWTSKTEICQRLRRTRLIGQVEAKSRSHTEDALHHAQ